MGQSISTLPAAGVNTGIAYAIQIQGIVSFYEEYDAMVEAHHSEETWQRLSPLARAEAVAAYRLRRYIKLHESDAVNAYQERAARRAKRRK